MHKAGTFSTLLYSFTSSYRHHLRNQVWLLAPAMSFSPHLSDLKTLLASQSHTAGLLLTLKV